VSEPDLSTVPTEPVDLGRLRRARWGRRSFFTLACAFLLAGLPGALGVRTANVSTTGAGYELTVHYAQVTRGGLATPWSVVVRHRGGFPTDEVTLATTAAYFDFFDENGLDPEPAGSVSDGARIIWTFPAPAGDTLSVSFDARSEPAVQFERARATTQLLENDVAVAAVHHDTDVLP